MFITNSNEYKLQYIYVKQQIRRLINMSKEKIEYCFVAKCLDLGCPRVWADTKESIEKAMEEWTAKQIRFKPLALWKYPLIHVKGSEYHIDWGYENDQGKYIDNGVQVI